MENRRAGGKYELVRGQKAIEPSCSALRPVLRRKRYPPNEPAQMSTRNSAVCALWKAAIRISFLPKLIVEPHVAAQPAAAQHGDIGASPIASCQPHSGAASQ
jgi:hypothetical protein